MSFYFSHPPTVIPAYQSRTGVPLVPVSLPWPVQVLCYHRRRSIFFFLGLFFPLPRAQPTPNTGTCLVPTSPVTSCVQAGRAASCPQPIYPRGPSIPFAILFPLSTRRSFLTRLPSSLVSFALFTFTRRQSSPTSLLLSDSLVDQHLSPCISLPRPPRQKIDNLLPFLGGRPASSRHTPTTTTTTTQVAVAACYAPARRKQNPLRAHLHSHPRSH